MDLNNLELSSQLDTLGKGNRADHIYRYQNERGEYIGGVVRWDAKTPDGSKTIRLIRKVACALEPEHWEYGAIPTPRPLYRLPSILTRSEATILIVEGEKTAEAAQKLFSDYVVTTTMGGANAPRKTDFSPLEGRHIIISPDNDGAGESYMQNIVDLCLQVNAASIKILSQKIFHRFQIVNGTLTARKGSLPPGYDLADALAEGWKWELLQEAGNQLQGFFVDAVVYNKDTASLNSLNESELAPLTEGINKMLAGYTLNVNGLYYEDYWVCSYIKVLAHTRDDKSKNWGRFSELTDLDGKIHKLTIPMTELIGDSYELIKRLLSFGLRIESSPKARNKLVNFLQNTPIEKRIVCIPKIGWHGEHFVLPNQVVPATNELVFQSEIEEFAGHAAAGSLEEWQDHIALPCRGNSRLLLALSTAVAAPLLSLVSHENFGFHFIGASSIGKTTALQVAASIWGSPKLQESWKATANALEAVAVSHNDSLLCLDELGQAEGKDVGEVVYMLANGSGKSRMKPTGDLRKKQSWKTLVLSTGEVSIEDKLKEFNRKPYAGMSTRLIEIPADTDSGYRLFDTIHQYKHSNEFANHLKEQTGCYYGSAIRGFLTDIRGYQEHLRQRLETMNGLFLSQFNTTQWCGQVKRVAKHFALVALAGEIAIEIKIFPFNQNEVFTGVVTCFQAWMNARGDGGDQELVAGAAQVKRFFEEHYLSRFAWDDSRQFEKSIPNLAGYKRKVYNNGEETGVEFFVFPEKFRTEICKGYNAQAILKELARQEILKRGNNRQFVSDKRLPLGKKKIYHFLPAILADGNEDNLVNNNNISSIYGETGETEGDACELTNTIQGFGVTSGDERQSGLEGGRGDSNSNSVIDIPKMSPLSPPQFTTVSTAIVDQKTSEIKSFRGMSPLPPPVTLKNSQQTDLEALTNAMYLHEERLALHDDYN
jgi:putative DNA primase/helicase